MERDVIWLMNKYSNLICYQRKLTKYLLRRNIPVAIDYTDDPEMVRELMDYPEIVIVPSVVAKKLLGLGVEKSEIEKVVEEDSNE